MIQRFLLLTIIAASMASEVEQKKAKLGKSAILECSYKRSVPNCMWTTSTKGIMAFTGNETSVENGRLRSVLSLEPTPKCTLYIENTKESDEGLWTCYGNDELEGTMREHQSFNLELMTKTLAISLNNPFDDLNNKTAMEDKQDLKCKVENSISQPEFSWFIEELPYDTIEEDIKTEQNGDMWIQTLTYQPITEHSNKSLKCLVKFESHLDEEESKESSIVLSFTNEDIETMVEKIPEEIVADVLNSDVTTVIIVIVVSVFGLVAMIYLLHSQKCCCFKNQPITEVDAEMAEQITDEKPKEFEETETEKADSSKEDKESTQELTESVKKSFGDRFASFFRLNKSVALENEQVDAQTDSDKVEEGRTEVPNDSNKESEEKKLEESEEKKPEETDEKPENKSETVDETTEIVVKSKFRSFFVKLFKPRDGVADKASEEPIKMADCEEPKEEYEPDTKPESQEVVEAKTEAENKPESQLSEPKEEKAPESTANETSF